MSKKTFIVLLILILCIIITAVALIIASLNKTGASDPADAVWCYERAAMLRDADGMLKYSSDYNKASLSEHCPPNISLEDYLNNQYSGASSAYRDTELTCKVISAKVYGSGEPVYSDLFYDYISFVPNAKTPESFALVKLEIYSNGNRVLTYYGYAAQIGSRWYFYKPNN